MCPSCLSGALGPGYIVAFVICILFFAIAALAMVWASKSGRLENLEDSKYKMLSDEELI